MDLVLLRMWYGFNFFLGIELSVLCFGVCLFVVVFLSCLIASKLHNYISKTTAAIRNMLDYWVQIVKKTNSRRKSIPIKAVNIS